MRFSLSSIGLLLKVASAAFCVVFAAPAALAQTGTVALNAFAIGQGPGVTGFKSLICTGFAVGTGAGSAPTCRVIASADIPTSVALTGTPTAPTAAADTNTTQLATTAFVLGQAGSALPLINGTAAVGTSLRYARQDHVHPTDTTRAPTSRLLNTTAPLSGGGDLTADRTLSIASNGVTNALLATAAANTLKGNATGSTATLTDIVVPSCSGANQALNWTSGTGPGCVTISGTGGAWSNTRLAKTAAYTTVTGDCGSTLALGGSAFYAVTFNAPSGYAGTCAFLALNEDTAFGKLLLPQLATSATSFTIGTGSKAFTTTAGLPINVYLTANSTQRYRVYSLANPANYMAGTVTAYSSTTLTISVDTIGGSGTFTDWQIAPEIRLWPGQSRWVFNQNNVWKLDNPTRWKLPGSTEICVDASTGSDSNDGLGSGSRCFKTIQFASNIVYQEWDANNFDPNIGLYTGPFNESVNIQGQITGYNFLRYRTRAANTWTNTGTCIAVSDNAEAIFDAVFGFTQTWQCNTANSANTGAIYEHQVAVIDIGGAHKWISGGTNDSFFFADGEGRATINGTGAGIIIGNSGVTSGYTFVNCAYHCSGVTIGGTLSYGGTISLSSWLIARSGSVIDHSANPTGTPGTIGVALSLGNSVIRLNGLTPPGGTPTASFQGVCATTC